MGRNIMYFVYIIYSEKIDKYYIGMSYDPDERLMFHNLGKGGWTKRGLPWELVFQKQFNNKEIAQNKENFIKRQKNRTFVEKLISGELYYCI